MGSGAAILSARVRCAPGHVVYNPASQPTKITYNRLDHMWVIDNTYGKTLEQRSLRASSITWDFGYGTGRALTIARSTGSLLTRSFDTAGRLAESRAGTGGTARTGRLPLTVHPQPVPLQCRVHPGRAPWRLPCTLCRHWCLLTTT